MANLCENLIIIENGEDVVQDINMQFVDGNDILFERILPTPPGTEDKRKFRLDNWGTRSNGDSVEFPGEDCISFITAWSPAEGIAKELSRIYNCEIKIIYFEASEAFGGISIYKVGEVVSEQNFENIDEEKYKELPEELRDFIGDVFEWKKETEKTFEQKEIDNGIVINGKRTQAVIFTKTAEKEAIGQIIELCNQDFATNSKIRIMPDCHAGKGCVIGTTMTITDKVVPAMVGVDIGCGMLVWRLGKSKIDTELLDRIIANEIPNGTCARSKAAPGIDTRNFYEEMKRDLKCYNHISVDRALLSIGTLGGGK